MAAAGARSRGGLGWPTSEFMAHVKVLRGFFFFIFFKNKKFKNICPFWNILKIPLVAPHRATSLKCKFFCSNSQWGPWKKKALSPPNGRQGPVAHWGGDRPLFFPGTFFFQVPILSYSSVYSSSSSAGSRPLTPTAPNLSFIKSRKKSQELPLFHEHYGTPKHNKFTSIVSIETNDK